MLWPWSWSLTYFKVKYVALRWTTTLKICLIIIVVVLLTDGVSNINPEFTIPQARFIKQAGTHIFAIGVGNFQPDELNAVASEPASENAFLLHDYASLYNLTNKIVQAACQGEYNVIVQGGKGRDLTQSYDKSPYTHRNIQKATWQHKNATINFDYATIADRLRTVIWRNISHPTGVVKPVYESSTFTLTATAVKSKGHTFKNL